MKINEVKMLEKKYFKKTANKLVDEQLVLDRNCQKEVVSGFNDLLIDSAVAESVDYLNQPHLTAILLDIFPEMFSLQSDFGTEIYVSLLSYYQFLYTEQVISETEYIKVLLFFQQRMHLFFKKLAKSASNIDGDFADIMEDFYGEGQGMIPELENHKSAKGPRNNVIQLPNRKLDKE